MDSTSGTLFNSANMSLGLSNMFICSAGKKEKGGKAINQLFSLKIIITMNGSDVKSPSGMYVNDIMESINRLDTTSSLTEGGGKEPQLVGMREQKT